MQIVITDRGYAYTQVGSKYTCCSAGDKGQVGCKVMAGRTLCDSSLCSSGTKGLEVLLGYPVKWKYIGDVPWKGTKVSVFYEGHMYTTHALGIPKICSNHCDAYGKPLCTKYSSGKDKRALCALLETVLKGFNVVFKEEI